MLVIDTVRLKMDNAYDPPHFGPFKDTSSPHAILHSELKPYFPMSVLLGPKKHSFPYSSPKNAALFLIASF